MSPRWQHFVEYDVNAGSCGDATLAAAHKAHHENPALNQYFENNIYAVHRTLIQARDGSGFADIVHLSIRRIDREPVRDWRDLQRIKNELVDPEALAIEVFPPESFLVDTSNQFHLWCVRGLAVPFMFRERLVSEAEIGNAKQRPFDEKPYDLLSAADLLAIVKKSVKPPGPPPACPEGGVCNYTPDIEYDATGETINCEKCGREPGEPL